MRITKTSTYKAPARRTLTTASRHVADRRRAIKADDEVTVTPEATEILFEPDEVGELVAEITGEDVVVDTDAEEDTAIFEVGKDTYEIEIDAEAEELVAKRQVRRAPARRDVRASSHVVRHPAPAMTRRSVATHASRDHRVSR